MSNPNSFKEWHIILNDAVDSDLYQAVQTISTNPHSSAPYMDSMAIVHGEHAFGDMGVLRAENLVEHTACADTPYEWDGKIAYHKHTYEIVVVVEVSPNQKIVKAYNQYLKEITLYKDYYIPQHRDTVTPMVGHKLLIKALSPNRYNVLRNITLEKKKWEMNQNII